MGGWPGHRGQQWIWLGWRLGTEQREECTLHADALAGWLHLEDRCAALVMQLTLLDTQLALRKVRPPATHLSRPVLPALAHPPPSLLTACSCSLTAPSSPCGTSTPPTAPAP